MNSSGHGCILDLGETTRCACTPAAAAAAALLTLLFFRRGIGIHSSPPEVCLFSFAFVHAVIPAVS